MKIEEKYQLQPIEHAIAPLERWYNRMLVKEPEQMTAGDILRALRQGIFTEVAEEMLIKLLQADIFAGDMIEGELLDALANFSSDSTLRLSDDIKSIVKTAELSVKQHDWIDEEDKEDYLASISRIKLNLANTNC